MPFLLLFLWECLFIAKSLTFLLFQIVDYDTIQDKTFNLEISVRDPERDGSNSPTNLAITVTDINDNAPVIDPPEFSTSFDEDVDIGYTVTTFTATDPDTGPGGIFR